MEKFDFYNPTHIVFGKDRLTELPSLIPSGVKVLITYGGGSVKKFGTLDKVKNALEDYELIEFGGIEPNPKFSTLMKAVTIVKEEKVGFLLAVGGGSVMDGTKFIAIAAHYDKGDPEKLLYNGFVPAPVSSAVPLGTVVTLPATGSEMNVGAVISHGDSKYPVMSPLTFPKFSFLDPTLTFTLPPVQIANGVIDAFVHVTEQYLTFPTDALFQDRTSEGILNSLIEIGKKTIEEPEDYNARANMMWNATMALNGLIGAGVPQDWTTHMIGQELTAHYGIDHAQTLAIILPAYWMVRKEQKKAKLLQYAERVWNITDGDDDARVEQAIDKTRAFFESLGIKTRMNEHGIGEEVYDKVLGGLKAKGMTALSETGDVTPDVCRKVLETAM